MSNQPLVVRAFERSRPIVLANQPEASLNGTLTWHDQDLLALEALFDKVAGGARPACYTTGVERIDAVTLGMVQGNVFLVAAPTGGGKSSFALTSAMALAMAQAPPVLYVSLEMPARDMAVRGMAWLTGISQGRLMAAQFGRVTLTDPEREAISQAARWIPQRIRMMAGSFSAAEIVRETTRMQKEHGLSVVVVDHVGLIRSENRRNQTREREVAEASRAVKEMAMGLNVPVMLLAQFNRAVVKEPEPQLHHLRDTGSLEQDASVVTFLWPSADENEKRRKQVFIRKNRFGETAEFETDWNGAAGRIGPLALESGE